MLEARWFALVDRIAVSESRRRGLKPETAEEFRAEVRLRFAERGERILAAHDGRSSVETYLRVVVARAFLDWQRAMWGYWRPSAEAARAGPAAIELDRRLSQLGESFETAAAEVASRFGSRVSLEELEELSRRLPERTRRREIAAEALDDLPASTPSADASLTARERASIAARMRPVLRRALRALAPVDRLVLLLVFRDGLSVRGAARAVGIGHKRVVRRLDRTLGHLRSAMEDGGLDRYAALVLLESPDESEGEFLRAISDPEWDNAPRRPSSGEAEP